MELELDSFDRSKREISNHFLQMDPIPEQLDEEEIPELMDDYEDVEPGTGPPSVLADSAILQDIKLPMKAGSPAFKIIASKVYILYPSMFQDPNIFGRFSIPQSINMEGKGDLSTITKDTNVATTSPPMMYNNEVPSMGPSMSSPSLPYNQPYPVQQQNNRQFQGEHQNYRRRIAYPGQQQQQFNHYRRQLPMIPAAASAGNTELPVPSPIPSSESIAKERSIQSHMRGQIVVQNQDVNEYNTQKGY